MTARLVYGEEERLLPWARERIGIEAFRPDARAIGLERGGELVAVVVFDNWSDVDAHIHIASDGTRRWMSKELLLATFAFAFTQAGLLRLTGMVDETNAQALAFDEHLGFVREGYHPEAGGPGVAMISLGLTKSRCRFI
ncbi:MAG: hypothetical protein K0S54_1142 [Alphaproteobacteria bacterium]|jgi:RimJ/RimL family protein N-acetyltransferase|nr:hypothetical protein [Alphaproteobacteria bacterium]